MRNARIGSQPKEPLPWRWQIVCRKARVLLGLPGAVRIADRPWVDEVLGLIRFGFHLSWDPQAAFEARTYVCELCGNDMDLRMFISEEGLGTHTYAYCTMRDCHWWLEF